MAFCFCANIQIRSEHLSFAEMLLAKPIAIANHMHLDQTFCNLYNYIYIMAALVHISE